MVSVIGGTYREINYDNLSTEVFGSGLRCSRFLLENRVKVNFCTSGTSEVNNYLKENAKVYPSFNFKCTKSESFITFKYNFSLDNPTIYPDLSSIIKTDKLNIVDENIICYGMLESDFSISGKRVIYDPQTSINPIKFSQIGVAEQLIYIVNFNEAKSLAESERIEEIKDFFFNKEKALALVIKNGPLGATLYYKNEQFSVPSYITDNVNKIGSGDIFTASFAYYWLIKKYSFEQSTAFASRSTALFCDTGIYLALNQNDEFKREEFNEINIKEKQVYLASPIFSLSEIILIDKVRNAFLGFGIKVFSPFHDIGLGNDESIARLDLEGIEKSDIIFCIFDNLDSGTLIEAGYSMAKSKKIIGYHTTCNDEELIMLHPSNIKTYDNLTTAIYQTIWSL